jgi:hypothetical protein
MTLRLLFLFIHVVSAMGVFGTLAIEGTLLLRLRRVTATTLRQDALNGFRLFRILGPLTLGPTVMSGMYLERTVWGWRAAWINVALGSLVFAAVVGIATTGLRIVRLQKTNGGSIRKSRDSQGDYGLDPVLWVSFVMRAAIFTGIVFLMTVKPGLNESFIVISMATVGGFLASVAILRAASTEGVTRKELQIAESE